MTLEKLLIFGFALAVFIALTATATSIMTKREPSNTKYQGNVNDLVDLAN